MTAFLSVLLLAGCGDGRNPGQATSGPNSGAARDEAGGVEGAMSREGEEAIGREGAEAIGRGAVGGMVSRQEAERAALEAVGAGRVTWVGREDDRGAAWEVEVTRPDGSEIDVLIAPDGSVIR